MPRARIFQHGTSATQSGRRGAEQWVLEFEPREAKRPDPLMGWAGSGDTRQQVRLSFSTREAAIAYAERNGIDAEVLGPRPHRLILQSYAENFR
ncbi:MAG: ETC complex I subunit [Thermaurantiacus sp.]